LGHRQRKCLNRTYGGAREQGHRSRSTTDTVTCGARKKKKKKRADPAQPAHLRSDTAESEGGLGWWQNVRTQRRTTPQASGILGGDLALRDFPWWKWSGGGGVQSAVGIVTVQYRPSAKGRGVGAWRMPQSEHGYSKRSPLYLRAWYAWEEKEASLRRDKGQLLAHPYRGFRFRVASRWRRRSGWAISVSRYRLEVGSW